MFKRRTTWFLLGALLGQLLLCPFVYYYKTTPSIRAIVVSDKYFSEDTTEEVFYIEKVPNFINRRPKTLKIHLAPERIVNEVCQEKAIRDAQILGCYDIKEHAIYSVPEPRILIHEFKHIFEGYFHR